MRSRVEIVRVPRQQSGPSPFANTDRDTASRYLSCRRGGEEGENIECFHLLQAGEDLPIGFVGLHPALEDLDGLHVLYLQVDFVYVREQHRGKHSVAPLSEFTLQWMIDKLDEARKKVGSGDLECQSISSFLTTDGWRFVRRVEVGLRTYCRAKRVRFVGSTLSAEGRRTVE